MADPIGAFSKIVLPLGRELFGFQLRGKPNIAKIAQESGITEETLPVADIDTLKFVLERATRTGDLDPRTAFSLSERLDEEVGNGNVQR